ncbi:hypothetical protein predicted by Glimmer/Critica (plasmid) [Salmonella enterica subsp. enterica serovar Weltevreden str. 2007-60-3289-1]|nr:hypothetical protein [Salmonella enterica subsp. enterica serovar Weltevreden]CBY98968.1 hypothetical protein predicted by Glimmer/Critica [Salmonella enterica subsp. enterica serovar Weltevreden str. 2007-60-3289-1]
MIQEKGRLAWQKAVKYGKRALVETMMACWKALIGPGVLQGSRRADGGCHRCGGTEPSAVASPAPFCP